MLHGGIMNKKKLKPPLIALVIFLPFLPGILFIKQSYIEGTLFLLLVLINYFLNPMLKGLIGKNKVKKQYVITIVLGLVVSFWLNYLDGNRFLGIFIYISISLFFTYPITKEIDKNNKRTR